MKYPPKTGWSFNERSPLLIMVNRKHFNFCALKNINLFLLIHSKELITSLLINQS